MIKKDQVKIAREILCSFDVPDEEALGLLQSPVAKVREMAEKFLAKKAEERVRINNISLYEKQLQKKGFQLIAGMDEAGCGPLVGPVVGGAVILPPDCCIWGLDDSKKLSEKNRLLLEQQIKEKALCWAVAWINHRQIDRYNILQARLKAMARAVSKLEKKPEYLLIDGNRALAMDIPQTLIIKGDSKSISIAAASILAKCARDRIMLKMAKLFPQYGFEVHKGYPTLLHRQSIALYGPSPIQRMSFSFKEIKNEEKK
ncbi:MAG: ribonuclease HII [Bacillota bacterium]|jgi:ribonuclease HII